MSKTSNKAETTITLKEAVDWVVGDVIVIASSDLEGRHAEKRTITAINKTNAAAPVVTFKEPLLYKHFAKVETYGGDTMDMRTEVGLLTRNIVYRGDPETSNKNMFGAHIMLHSPGDESVIGRIENIELTDVGQAFQLGRYPIHFHMIGTVHQSYARNNAIHQTYNRAVTLHGVHYFKVINNVAYDTMGHTIFIEDAAETKNRIEGNLIIQTKRSWSLLNTDQSPGSFWITHPDNIIKNNHAAGSDRYGYWYDLQETAVGPSFSKDVCPISTQLGEFKDNVAHSSGRYGLRIFHNHTPLTKPCSPYHATTNPMVPAVYENFTGYSNGRNGAIAGGTGAVQFKNFKVADNLLAGIEFEMTWHAKAHGNCFIDGGLVIGTSTNDQAGVAAATPRGIITPRSEWFSVKNVKFHNWNWSTAAAIGSCSHCWHGAATDSGARQVNFSGLTFTNADKRINYQVPWRAIYYDIDGSLTNKGEKSWATPYWLHNDWSDACERDPRQYSSAARSPSAAVDTGLVCTSAVQVRRVAWSGYSPGNFRLMSMRIA